MPGEAIVVDFQDGSKPMVVVGEVSRGEYGRYLVMGCTIVPYRQINKNGIPVMLRSYRYKRADVVVNPFVRQRLGTVSGDELKIQVRLDDEFPFFMMRFPDAEGGKS